MDRTDIMARVAGLLALAVLAWLVLGARGQAELLSVTSFVECVDIDRSARDPTTQQGRAGNFLDCTPTSDPQSTGSDTVTIIDARIIAGSSGGNSAFEVNLTTVTSDTTPPTSSTDGGKCQLNLVGGVPQPTNCKVSQHPYSIVLSSSEYIYYYDLTADESVELPYCHVVHFYDTASAKCDNITYEGSGGNTYNKYTQTCSARVERIPGCKTGSTGANNASPQCERWMDALSTRNIYGIMTGKNPDQTPFNISEYYAAYVGAAACVQNDTRRCIRTEFSSDALRKPAPPMYTGFGGGIPWDDAASIRLGEMFGGAAYTLHDLALPSPLPLGLDESPAFQSTTGAPGDLQVLNCVGPCEATQQNCYNTYDATEPDAVRANGTTLESEGVDVGLFGLGPACRVYNVALTPRVAVRITATLRDLVTNETFVVSTDDVTPGTQAVSNDTGVPKTFAMEIVTVGSLNNVLGPPLGGAILVCGGPIQQEVRVGARSFPAYTRFDLLDPPTTQPPPTDAPPFFNMREQMAPFAEVGNPFYNPWGAVLARADADSDGALGFYPSNRYMGYSDACAAPARDPADTRTCDQTNVMWYYVNSENRRFIGRGCDQLGITDMFWNVGANGGQTTASQFAADTCNSDPFICAPGFSSAFAFENRTLAAGNTTEYHYVPVDAPVTGCMASTAFEIAREVPMPPGFGFADEYDPANYAGYWNAFGQPELLHSTLGVVDQTYSLATTINVLENYVPRGYNPTRPNYWLQTDETPRLYFKPDNTVQTPAGAAFSPELSVEVVLYLVGKFVAFEDAIPAGRINQGPCVTDTTFAVLSSQQVTVTNLGTIAGQYQVNVACPPRSQIYAPVASLVVPPTGTLPPGNESVPVTIYYDPNPDFEADPDKPVEPCQLTLLALNTASELDQQNVICNHTFIDQNGTEPAPAPFFFPNNTGWSGKNCRCMDFACWKAFRGGTLNSPCALALTIMLVIGGVGILVALLSAILYRFVFYRRLLASRGDIDNIIAQSNKRLRDAAAR